MVSPKKTHIHHHRHNPTRDDTSSSYSNRVPNNSNISHNSLTAIPMGSPSRMMMMNNNAAGHNVSYQHSNSKKSWWWLIPITIVPVIVFLFRGNNRPHNFVATADQDVFLKTMGESPSVVSSPPSSTTDTQKNILLIPEINDLDMESFIHRTQFFLGTSKNSNNWNIVSESADQRRMFVQQNCPSQIKRYDEISSYTDIQLEIWKYCQMSNTDAPSVAYLDARSPLLYPWRKVVHKNSHLAILQESYEKSVHSALLVLSSSIRVTVAQQMLQLISSTSLQKIKSQPLLLPQALYPILIDSQKNYQNQNMNQKHLPILFLQQECDNIRNNPTYFKCHIILPRTNDHNEKILFMTTPESLLPRPYIPTINERIAPYHSSSIDRSEDWPFISTLREVIHPKGNSVNELTPNFFELLSEMDSLPTDKYCNSCLRDKSKGSSCHACQKECKAYCKHLCHLEVPEKHISKTVTITPPLYQQHHNRHIPKIIHQTYYETVTKEKYPNMSRLIQSWEKAGWKYYFYNDDDIANILITHFPPEVKEAFDALQPGAFKADLFRYCVLLIYGGVYADMDVLLEGNLDSIVSPDIGFMVPQDEPGKSTGHRMCLWNGFIAAAPGHAYLAETLQSVVNNIRNRFTSVDMDHTLCPKPDLSVSHSYDMLFTAGPCILGASVNRVLQRHSQTAYVPGDLEVDDEIKQNRYIPGRSIILHQVFV